MEKYIEITISPQGKTNINAVGFSGDACKIATRPLEEKLGLVENREDKTPTETERERVSQ
jgi:hypothetical protein